MGENNKFLWSFFIFICYTSNDSKIKLFCKENFKLQFFVVRLDIASRTSLNQEKYYIDYVPNSLNLKICKNLTVIEEFGNEYNISGCVSTNFWL